MTRNTNARIAGVTLLFYFVAGLGSMAVGRDAPVAAIFPLLTSFSALVLGVTFYALTREVDADLALLAMVCRVIEGVPRMTGELHFAVGSLLFSWLLLSGRMVPIWLARLGVFASVLLIVAIPLQLTSVIEAGWQSPVTWALWSPMAVFEIVLALWLIFRGAASPARVSTPPMEVRA